MDKNLTVYYKMDYKKIIFHIFIILAILPRIISGITNHNRDIILSPNKVNHHPGKIIYYRPEQSVPTTNGDNYSTISADNVATTKSKPLSTPWEDALKYSTYLAFNDRDKHDYQNDYKHTSQPTINHKLLDFNVLNKASYIPQDHYSNYQKFGDIVMLARGKLQRNERNQISFIEANLENCELNKLCHSEFTNSKENNLLALWMIEKIRHRNSNNHGHRFEMRITVMPNNNEHTTSFILRDIDYPNMFVNHEANRQVVMHKSKINRSFFDLVDLFKNGPAPLNYRPQLNTGEYFAQGHQQYPIPPPTQIPENYVHLQRPTLPFVPQNNLVFPTATYFDQYKQQHQLHNFRFPESTTPILTNKLSEQPPMMTHLHHHFYVNNKKVNEFNPHQQYQQQEQPQHPHQFIGDVRGITNPNHAPRLTTNYEHSPHITQKPEFNTYETPQVFNDQIPVPPNFQIQQQPIHHHQHNEIVHIPQQNHNHHHHHEQQQQQPPHQSHQQIFEVPYVIHQPQYYQPQNIPVTTVQYMQQLQIPPYNPIVNIPSSSTYRPNHHGHPQNVQTFHESPQYIEQQKFSEPDPIYHPDIYRQNYPQEYYRTSLPTPLPHTDSIRNINHLAENQNNNFEVINTKESEKQLPEHHQDSRDSHDNYPDSINAQLPPPEQHANVNVPYVETSVVTQKSASPPVIIVPSLNQNHQVSPSSSNHIKSESSETKTFKSKVNARQSLRQQISRTTTEKPVLKWMPKRIKSNRVSSTSTPNITTTVEPSKINTEKIECITSKLYSSKYASSSTLTPENFITITPSTSTSSTSTASSQEPSGMESQTRKSFSTSISVEIGDKKHKLFHDLKPKIKLTEIGRTEDHDKKTDENKIEMIKADIQSMNTNSAGMHLFRASDELNSDKRQADVNLDPIALSIIQHAKSISRH